MQVAIYARHSTDKQEHSTRDQIARCQKWCAQKGLTVANVFYDEAVSGSTMRNRPGLRTLIETSLLGDFTRVVTEDLSRISRDQEDIASFFKKMVFLDIGIETISEGVINELHIGLKGTMNALYLKDLADKTHRGQIAAVLNGSIPGGCAFGYDVIRKMGKDGEPIRGLRRINTKHARIVRRIFNDYQDGATLNDISTRLNKMAIPSPTGVQWSPTVLIGTKSRMTGILRQTLYKGLVTFNKMTYRKHPDTGKRLSILRPEEEWIRVPVPELTIIPESQFDRIQGLIDERSTLVKLRSRDILTEKEKKARHIKDVLASRARQMRPRRLKLYLISNNLWCAEHKRSMVTARGGLHGCHVKTCLSRNLKRELLVSLTQKSLATLTLRDLKEHIEKNNLIRIKICAERVRLQAVLDDKRTEIDNVLQAFEKGKPGEETLRYLDGKEKECRRFLYDIKELNEREARLGKYTASDLKHIIGRYKAFVRSQWDNPLDEALIKTLHGLIRKIWITTKWDDADRRKNVMAGVEFDFQMVLRACPINCVSGHVINSDEGEQTHGYQARYY